MNGGSSMRPKHRQTSNKDARCGLCKKYFPSFAALHSHAGTSPAHRARFGCDACDTGFLKRSVQRDHMHKHHGGESPQGSNGYGGLPKGHTCHLCSVVLPLKPDTYGRRSPLYWHTKSDGHQAREREMKQQYYHDNGWDEQMQKEHRVKTEMKHFLSRASFNHHMQPRDGASVERSG